MRTAFVDTIYTLMEQHEDILIITADMGFSVFEKLQKDFPKRFINSGITEQASIGLATGLAMSGYTVYFYAQAAFSTMRCFEQVRLDVAYGNANVKIIGVSAGFSLNQLGVSHFAIEDVGLMRMLPGMTVYTPGDPIESAWGTAAMYNTPGPAYMRVTKGGCPIIHKEKTEFAIGKGVVLEQGKDASLLVSGSLLPTAQKVVNNLSKKGISVSLVTFPTVKPLDKAVIREEAKKTKHLFTLEEHSIIGGLGSAVAELIAEEQLNCSFKRIGSNDTFTSITGSYDFLLDYNGLSEKKIQELITNELKNIKKKF